jgi:DNA-binding LacI/PurR family transcriptional regulator
MTKKKQKQRSSSIDVARLAGVSQSAVSRAFTPGASISEKKKKLIHDAALTLSYRPNVIARSLVQNSTKIIGLVMTRFSSPFYTTVLGDFTRHIQENGFSALLLNIDNDQEVYEVLSTALQYQVDGLIITSANLSSVMVDSCLQSRTPIVLFNRYSENNKLNAVYCDGYDGGRIVADLLIPHHTRFACIKGESGSSTSRDRSSGYISRLNEKGIADCISEHAEFSYESGFEAAKKILALPDRPDALFCVSDLMALGAMDAARKVFKLKIPEDLSIVGFDNIPMASWHNYELTTAAQPAPKMAEVTVDLLLKSIKNPSRDIVIRKMKTELIIRSTVRGI